MRGSVAAWAPAAPLLFVLAIFLLSPIVNLLARSVITADGIGLDAWARVLSQPINQRAIVTSLQLGLICAVISVVVGLPLAWLISRMLVGRRSAWLGLMNVTAHFGGIGLAFAYHRVAGHASGSLPSLIGALGIPFDPPDRDTLAALVITYEHANIPLFVLLTVPAMGMLRREWSEAAETTGATRADVLATHRPADYWRHSWAPGSCSSFTWSIGIYGIAYALAGQSRSHPRAR